MVGGVLFNIAVPLTCQKGFRSPLSYDSSLISAHGYEVLFCQQLQKSTQKKAALLTSRKRFPLQGQRIKTQHPKEL